MSHSQPMITKIGLPRGQLAKIVFPISLSLITFVGVSILTHIYALNVFHLDLSHLPMDAILFCVFGTIFIVSLLRAAFTSPGLVQKGWNKKDEVEELTELLIQNDDDDDDACVRPPRSHYCYELQSNVLRMDHFCIWFNNAVGLFNYKYFVLTMCYLSVICLLIICIIIYRVFISPIQPFEGPFKIFCVTISLLLCVFFGIFGAMHSAMHLWLASKNLTSIEYRQFVKIKSEAYHFDIDFVNTHQFDDGMFCNLKKMLGANVWFWWLPIAPSLTEDGYEFKVNRQNKTRMQNLTKLIQSEREKLWKLPKTKMSNSVASISINQLHQSKTQT
eukprot:593725_1